MCEVDREQQIAGGGASIEVVGDPPAQRSLALGVVAAKIRVKSFAHQVVEGDSLAELLAEAAALKPLQLLLGVAVRQHVGQQRLGHAAGDRGGRQGAPVGAADLLPRKPPDHPLDELLVVDAALRPPVGIRRITSAAKVSASGDPCAQASSSDVERSSSTVSAPRISRPSASAMPRP